MPDTIEHAPVPALVASSAADPIPPQDKGQPGLQKKDFEELNERLLAMPRDVGWLMVSIGVIGVALPGIVGTPALLAGGLMLWPLFGATNQLLAGLAMMVATFYSD